MSPSNHPSYGLISGNPQTVLGHLPSYGFLGNPPVLHPQAQEKTIPFLSHALAGEAKVHLLELVFELLRVLALPAVAAVVPGDEDLPEVTCDVKGLRS